MDPPDATSLSDDEKSAVMIAVLKAKVAELEKALVKDNFSAARNTLDQERTSAELQTARKNCEILSQNVETLKGVALHLAGQLEEANIRIATFEEKQKVRALKLESDLSQEIASMKKSYETRLDDLRAALRMQEDAAQRNAALLESREDAALRRIAELERAKDSAIRELTHEIEVLRSGLALRSDKATRVTGQLPGPDVWHPTLGPRHPSAKVGSSATGAVTVVAMTVGMSQKDAELARFANGIPMSGSPRSIVMTDPLLHVDVTADPTVVEPLDIPPAGRVGTNKWGFEMPSGQQLMITVEIV